MSEDRLETLHRQASTSFLKGDIEAAVAAWQEVLTLFPEDEQAVEGLRLCEQNAGCVIESTPPLCASTEEAAGEVLEDLDLKLDMAEAQAPAADLPPLELSLPETAPEAEAPGEEGEGWQWGAEETPSAEENLQATDVAIQELRRRIDQLLEEGRASVAQGDRDQALKVVDRVLILDEQNREALELRAQLLEAGDGRPTAGAEDLGSGPELDLSDDDPTVQPIALQHPESTGEPEGHDPSDDDPVDDDGVDMEEEVAEPVRAAAAPSPNKKIYIAAGVVAVAALAYGGWTMFGPDGAPADDLTAPAARERPARAKPETSPSATPAAEVEVEPAPLAGEDVAALLARAEQEAGAGNHAAAIVSFGKVLEAEPDNDEVRQRLRDLADVYRAEQERQERWNKIAGEFEQYNYREALKMLYRMPAEADQQRVRRQMVNSWYNLGVQSLQARDCARSVEHLQEASDLDPGDVQLAKVLALAMDCGQSGSPGYEPTVRALTLRAIDD